MIILEKCSNDNFKPNPNIKYIDFEKLSLMRLKIFLDSIFKIQRIYVHINLKK